jgi:DNA primase
MARDVKKIASTVDIVEVINDIVPLKQRGGKFMGICPFHNDHKSSLIVNRPKQVFKCFACGTGGDIVDFFMKMGNTFHEAVDKIEFKKGIKESPIKLYVDKPKPLWKQITHPSYFPKRIRHYEFGKPSFVWGYHNADGSPMGYVCRFDLQDDKEIVPYVFATDGNKKQWRWMGFDKPRVLYNLPQLLNEPEKGVIVIEGEKAAEAAKKLFTKHVVVSWQGGAEAIRYTDFSPLEGRSVIFIPDADLPGYKAMIIINEMVKTQRSLFVDTMRCKPIHWDIADEPDWNSADANLFVRANLVKELKFENELKQAA